MVKKALNASQAFSPPSKVNICPLTLSGLPAQFPGPLPRKQYPRIDLQNRRSFGVNKYRVTARTIPMVPTTLAAQGAPQSPATAPEVILPRAKA